MKNRLSLVGALVIYVFTTSSFSAHGAISAGQLVIVGYDDYLDSFTVMNTKEILAGEEVYFTNNGWNTELGQFNGAYPDQGAGNESVIKLTATHNIAKGALIYSNADSDSWTWTRSGLIPGQEEGGLGVFSDLSLDYESDQIYIFQGSALNPLVNPTNFIYALHFGSIDYPTFSDSADNLTGAIPPGLSLLDHTAFAQTDFSFHGDADGNHSAWGLNLADPDVAFLQAHGGHTDQWLAVVADSSNWGQGQPNIGLSFFVMPEPSRALLILIGGAGAFLKRTRKSRKL